VPPCDIELGIEVAFGEFCTNAGCTSYEWGIKGKLVIVGYDIGMYFGFDHGIDFILGNDDHILIDQYGGMARSLQTQRAGAADRVAVWAASPAVNGVSTETLPVSADAESLLVALGWQAGAPELTLYDGGGNDVTVSSAYTVTITTTEYSELMGVQLKEPSPGEWHAVLSNLTGIEHYKFIYFASKGAPGTPDDPGRFLTPGPGVHGGTGIYTVTWEVPPGTPVSATISLYYTRYYQESGHFFTFHGDVKEVPIVKNLPLSAGSYAWDTSGLRNYEYLDEEYSENLYGIRAVVDDGVNDFPPDAVYDPLDPCQISCELPSERAFDPDRFPGISTFSSPGYVVVTDNVAPDPPKGLELEGVDGAILARWDPSPEKDLAAYVIRRGHYSEFPWPGGWTRYVDHRVTAVVSPALRLGGVTTETERPYQVAVKAIDVNGNESKFSSIQSATPTSADMDPVPRAPISLTVASQTATDVGFAWSRAATGGDPDSYQLVYQWLVDFEAIGGYTDTYGYVDTTVLYASVPVTDGPPTAGMRTGASYRVWVSAANSDGWTSASSDPITVTVTDGVDKDGDGLPDDWAMAHAVYSATLDADLDGLHNALELSQGTDPTAQDSDGDSFSDWEEWDAGSNALDNVSIPPRMTQPRLRLLTNRLEFHAKNGQPDPKPQAVAFENVGGGRMRLRVETDSDWIEASLEQHGFLEKRLRVAVDSAGLQPGCYAGVVRLEPEEGSDSLIGGPHCVRVRLWVSPADGDIPSRELFLPLVGCEMNRH
jgi:hypothetical protein